MFRGVIKSYYLFVSHLCSFSLTKSWQFEDVYVIFAVSGYGKRSFISDCHGGTPVLGPALRGGVIGNRVILSISFGREAVGRDTLPHQIGDDGFGPIPGEVEIRFGRSHIIGEARDVQVNRGAVRENGRDIIDLPLGLGLELAEPVLKVSRSIVIHES